MTLPDGRVPCPECDGDEGSLEGDEFTPCEHCDGDGYVDPPPGSHPER